ncbi:MAG: 50S ribosomal protein L9 [Candidatus Omnitrophica bacterium]|nr:50S ribosomal protein L9 [Candidatus Omnitrophota bacterium]
MNVILIQDVEKLGKMGDEIKAKDGFARNYLIPQKLAIEATLGAVKIVEKKKKERVLQEQKVKNECQALADKIAQLSCTITVEAGEGDKLFGAVTTEHIAEVLLQEGVEIDKRKILLDEPIKSLGVYNVNIKLHPEVTSQARIWVVKK